MMLVPRRSNGFDLFDDFFKDDDFFPMKGHHSFMKADIKEKDNKYIIEMDMPGFTKENINIELNNGYLDVSAKMNKEEKKENGEKFIHRERFYGECSRSFRVGDINKEDINAEFKNGVLIIEVPKKDENKERESKRIEIK